MTTTYEARTEAAQEAYLRAAEREPVDSDWGLLFTDESGPRTIVFRAFAWFPTRDQLLDFVRSDFVFCGSHPPEEGDVERVLADLARRTDAVRTGSATPQSLVRAFTEQNGQSQSLDWIGTFYDLCQSDEAAERLIRAEFWSSKNDQHDSHGPQPPIDASESRAFIEFLQSYGV